MNLDNILKAIFTTLLGVVAMSAAGVGWWIEYLNDTQAGVLGVLGFVLLFMKDKIPDWISRLVDAIFDKFFTKK